MAAQWLDWTTTIATAAAALLAAVTIRQAKRQARESADRLVEERRVDYGLAVLRDLAQAIGDSTRTPGWQNTIRAMLIRCPARIPLARAMFSAGATPAEMQAFTDVLKAKQGSGETALNVVRR